jgi:hypothetical protein
VPSKKHLFRSVLAFAATGTVLLGAGVVSASADSWTVEGGTHYLKTGSGELIKSWTAKEWQLWRKQVQSLAECVGIAGNCAAKELKGETPLEDVPRATAEAAEKGIESARAVEGSFLSARDKVLDEAGGVAGTLPTGLGFEAIEHAKLVPGIIGVGIGNGLSQLYEVPEKRPFTSEKEEEETERIRGEFREHVIGPLDGVLPIVRCIDEHETFEGECEHRTTLREYPVGTYILAWPPAQGNNFGHIEEIERCESG